MVSCPSLTPPSITSPNLDFRTISLELCLSLMTIPVLTGLVLGSTTLKALQHLGELTESGLHRYRLPTLTVFEETVSP